MNYLLRLEGVNLGRFVFDTRDLSTVRGASLTLLNAVPETRKKLQDLSPGAQALSQGASAGLFLLSTADSVGVVSQVRAQLRKAHPHATFVVDVVPATGDFPADREAALAANRWRQMQAATLAVPATPAEEEVVTPPACERDGLRPALKSLPGPRRDDGSPTYLSAATDARRAVGRRAKQDFYEELTSLPGLPNFAEDFAAIAEDIQPLKGKLAVFYADGNAFGGTQQRLCPTPEKQALWDHFIRTSRRRFLTEFLQDELQPHTEWMNNTKAVARFETLLWGGDELMFVMPASLGWRFATRFFDKLGGLRLDAARFPTPSEEPQHPFAGNTSRFETHEELTHTAALVFCQHHAPIDRIKHLAKDSLAEPAKERCRRQDQLLCVALESFDHLGTDYPAAMNRRYDRVVEWHDMILAPRGGLELPAVLRTITEGIQHLGSDTSRFARSQLRGLVEAMLRNPSAGDLRLKTQPPEPPTVEELPRAFRNATPADAEVLIRRLRPLFPSDAALWFQLEELTDYVLP